MTRSGRLVVWAGAAVTVLVTAGALGAGGLAAPPRGLGRPGPRAVPPPAACSRGPELVSDFEEAPGGYLRFPYTEATEHREFYFVRGMYSDNSRRGFGFRGRGGGIELGDGGPPWSIDYVSADRHIVMVTQRLSNIDACQWEHPVSLADPELRRFPFVYSLEWGNAALSEAEVEGLRGYLEAGGLLMLDDFWGTYEWENFERQIHRVLPGRAIVDVPRDHLLFHIHYTIEGEILQVPNIGRGQAVTRYGDEAPTWERDGYVAAVKGIFDSDGRLMVVIHWNTDLGDALEWAENPYYPLKFSTFASELFLNTIMYSLTQ